MQSTEKIQKTKTNPSIMLLVFVFISLLCECLAWWGHGHLLVAEIAVAHLNKTAPDVLDVAFKMVCHSLYIVVFSTKNQKLQY